MPTIPNDPDPRTADDDEGVSNRGVSSPEPAEGDDGDPGPNPGSPQG